MATIIWPPHRVADAFTLAQFRSVVFLELLDIGLKAGQLRLERLVGRGQLGNLRALGIPVHL